jgi:hypothetical protein
MRALLLVAFVAPVLAACGAKTGNDLDGAATALSKAGSSRVEINVSSGKKQLFQARGSFDYARDVGEIKFVAIDESITSETPAPVAVRFIDRTVYTGWSFSGKLRWQKEEEWEPTDPEELIVPFEGGPAPDRVLELLLKTSKRTEIRGSEEIRGVKAKHYRLHVDGDAVLREYGIENALDDHDRSPLVVDAWFDDDNLVRRLIFPGEEEAGEKVVFDFYDFGVDVDVEAPSQKEVIGEREFEKLMEAECKALAKEKDFCAALAAAGEGEEAPVETVPEP